jgi:hypothetical protein
MKILKTSALAAVLALGSLSANAAYTDTDSFKLVINAAASLSITFDNDNLTFDNVKPDDTLSGSIGYTLSGSSSRDMTCIVTDEADNSGTNNQFHIRDDASDLLASITINEGECAAGENTLTVTGSIASSLSAGTTTNAIYKLNVSYATQTTIVGAADDDTVVSSGDDDQVVSSGDDDQVVG